MVPETTKLLGLLTAAAEKRPGAGLRAGTGTPSRPNSRVSQKARFNPTHAECYPKRHTGFNRKMEPIPINTSFYNYPMCACLLGNTLYVPSTFPVGGAALAPPEEDSH